MNGKISSYTAASGGFPIKIFKNLGLVSGITNQNRIAPIHLQLNPTNHCNLNCRFCSCSERDKSFQLSKEQISIIFSKFRSLGCKAVTITGGGEPLMWKEGGSDIGWIIGEALRHGIEAGLVTNGRLFYDFDGSMIDPLTWIRVSLSDETNISTLLGFMVARMTDKTDWSFSYVVTSNPNVDNIYHALQFANKHNFTHVRIVNDILKPVTNLESLRNKVLDRGANDKLAIWQDRQHYTIGTPRCLISLLKPTIGADGLLYPCCGSMYAQEIPAKDYCKSMAMGGIDDIEDIWENQQYYDGRDCVKCYYEHYNSALTSLIDDVDHAVFV
jgi:MoaA/NifB/PqqE/SkfB family radical SAM enzyme